MKLGKYTISIHDTSLILESTNMFIQLEMNDNNILVHKKFSIIEGSKMNTLTFTSKNLSVCIEIKDDEEYEVFTNFMLNETKWNLIEYKKDDERLTIREIRMSNIPELPS